MRLVLYVERDSDDGPQPVTGGQLTLTTRLDVDPAAVAVITQAIRQQRAATPDGSGTIHVTQPHWTGGAVDVRLTSSISATGQPSLFGGNRCALSRSLTAEEAEALRQAWDQQLPDGRIVYRMQMAAMTSAQSRSTVVERSTVTREFTFAIDEAVGREESITREGPLWNAAIERALSTIDVSR